MEDFTEEKYCKYCGQQLRICTDEGLECSTCRNYVHIRCLKRGSVPGGLNGDIFFTLICEECSSSSNETFSRNKLSWLQIITLVLYHLQTKNPGLARKGFFHWRNHIATFIDRHWDILFSNDVKKKKKWTGTVAGTLSHFGSFIFLSGTSTFNEPAWWTLKYPKLSPSAISSLYSLTTLEKQKAKIRNEKRFLTDTEIFQNILSTYVKNEELLQPFNINIMQGSADPKDELQTIVDTKKHSKLKNGSKRKLTLPSISTSRKYMKLADSPSILPDESTLNFNITDSQEKSEPSASISKNEINKVKESVKLLDPFCHYNTSLNTKQEEQPKYVYYMRPFIAPTKFSNLFHRNMQNTDDNVKDVTDFFREFNYISRMKGQRMQVKLTGGIRKEHILSPYSALYLKPFIRRDAETCPPWLRLMAELQLVANRRNSDYVLPPRAPIDYTYVQPEHIPAINSICNQFFWPGIDLTESLQYPDYSCVVLYKKLIVGFAFLVPDVKHTENYLSFVFTRPMWRNCGIAKFMIYHLIQTSLGKDITLHVSINNPAFFLYQKFGFKVENVVLDFYDKYFRSDVLESKHAFFCRLER